MHPYIESLNSFKVFHFGGQNLSLQYSLIDLIVLEKIFDYGDELKACFFIDSELKEINPIYESFKRIDYVYFGNYEDAFAMLNILKQISIQEIDNIDFCQMNPEKVEQIINQLLNYKIHTLRFFAKGNWESISNLALENISKINLQKLHQLILNI